MAEPASLIFLESPALCRVAFRPRVIARNVLVFLEELWIFSNNVSEEINLDESEE